MKRKGFINREFHVNADCVRGSLYIMRSIFWNKVEPEKKNIAFIFTIWHYKPDHIDQPNAITTYSKFQNTKNEHLQNLAKAVSGSLHSLVVRIRTQRSSTIVRRTQIKARRQCEHWVHTTTQISRWGLRLCCRRHHHRVKRAQSIDSCSNSSLCWSLHKYDDYTRFVVNKIEVCREI